MEFRKFKEALQKQYKLMSAGPLFRTTAGKDEMWECYLSSFPEGSNPIYKERTSHDCNCCKGFIRAVGNMVQIKDGNMISLWDALPEDPMYAAVAASMATLIKSKPVENVFLHYESKVGTEKTFEATVDGGVARQWDHFALNLNSAHVARGDNIGTRLGQYTATHDVMLRGLKELDMQAVDTVLELIEQNSLYRGSEFLVAVKNFKEMKKKLAKAKNDEFFVWEATAAQPSAGMTIRNTAIGTLLVDLSAGMEIDDAVRSFESKVAPTNYKRPTSLVTAAMIEKAKKTINDLGLTSALDRRYATRADISADHILFADANTKKAILGDVFDDIASKTSTKPKNLDRIEEVTIDQFIQNILPKATTVELMLDNAHQANLVSLIAPADATAKNLFKWDNNFSWSYKGDVTDSIKERVKTAGGSVVGDLCCRLAWYNHDDLDFHMYEPRGDHIYFANRRSSSGGSLDVDMNAGGGQTRTPVENIFYPKSSGMQDGTYKLYVNNFRKRETTNVGFEVEVDAMGQQFNFVYDKAVSDNMRVDVAEISYDGKGKFTVKGMLPMTSASKEVWGISTNTFQKVSLIMLSPNFWGENGVGNKNYFFMLDGCQTDESARGFYNEFLKNELNEHRKVFEIVGSKMRAQETPNQLSGVGFSSTMKNAVLARVTGSFTRTIKITF